MPSVSATRSTAGNAPAKQRSFAEQGRLLSLLLLVPALLLLLGVFIAPLAQIFLLSFGEDGWTLDFYQSLVGDDILLAVLVRTLWLSITVTGLCLLLGYPVAYLMLRSSDTIRRVIALLVILPLWTSLLVRTYAWIVILGRKGLVNEGFMALGITDAPMTLLYNSTSVYIGMVHIMLPFMVLPLYAIMQRIDLRLLSAARSLGAGKTSAFFLIFLPLSLPGVLAGSLLVFIIAIGFFVTPALLGGLSDTTFVMLIERQVNRLFNWPLASAMSVALLLATLLLVTLYNRVLAGGGNESPLIGRAISWILRIRAAATRPFTPARRLGREQSRWAPLLLRLPLPSFSGVVGWSVLFFMVAPITIVFPLAFSDAPFLQFPPPGYSTRWFENYFGRPDWVRPTITSFEVATVAMVLATIVGTLAAIGIVRGRFPGKKAMLGLLLAPIIVPTIVLAVALYYQFAGYGLIGTRTALILAHSVIAIPYVVVVVSAALEKVDISLEQAAWTLGAGRVTAFWKVTFPLIRPAVIVAALFAFLASFDELVIAIFISGTRATTLPKRMWDGVREEIDPTIAAVAALLITLSLFLLLVAEILRRRGRQSGSEVTGGLMR